MVVNILDNAIKYSEGAPQIRISTQTLSDRVLLQVQDRGMNGYATQNSFRPFYREQSGNIHNIKGHGLGLSYVKKIADLHQAKIDLESKKERVQALPFPFH